MSSHPFNDDVEENTSTQLRLYFQYFLHLHVRVRSDTLCAGSLERGPCPDDGELQDIAGALVTAFLNPGNCISNYIHNSWLNVYLFHQ